MTCVVATALCGVSAAQDSAIASLERLGAALRAEDAWRAEYRQEYIASGMGAGEEVAGVVTVAWPDRALFRSGEPVQQEMALDGRVVRLIDLAVPSCDEHLLDDEEWARVPLAAVLDPQGALDHFTVLAREGRGFVLVPREPGGVDRVEVALTEDNLPEEVVVIDPQGAKNHLRFSAWTPVDGPPDGSWLPDPPAGLECVGDERGDF